MVSLKNGFWQTFGQPDMPIQRNLVHLLSDLWLVSACNLAWLIKNHMAYILFVTRLEYSFPHRPHRLQTCYWSSKIFSKIYFQSTTYLQRRLFIKKDDA